MAGVETPGTELVLSDSEVTSTMVSQDPSAVVLAVADSVSDSVNEMKENIHHEMVHSVPLSVSDLITHVPSGMLGSTDNATLQSLLQSNSSTLSGASFLGQTDGIQIITVANPVDFMNAADGAPNRVWQIVPGSSPEIATIVAVQDSDFDTGVQLENQTGSNEVSSVGSSEPMPPLVLTKPIQHVLPPKCPAWAARLKYCEKIGDSYRGYVESEVELDLLLTYHKQQTQSFWGTRQSPSQSRVSKRLMWKSQYVPMDGIPFINSGSRAVVMECQYGPRRKGFPQRKDGDTGLIEISSTGEMSPLNHPINSASGSNTFRKTCPARIYIKKVKKFPQYAVDPNLEKKHLKIAMDKSFQALRNRLHLTAGQERYYVQLPTEDAHEFHNAQWCDTPEAPGQRLHPRVVEKIRELVADGETRLYAVRKAVRTFVSSELFSSRGEVPERHDLTYFPTVNDLKNHIHAALADIENGTLPFTAQSVNLEVMDSTDGTSEQENNVMEIKQVDNTIWPQPTGGEEDGPTPETVTVTLTQHPGEGGHHVISRIETHLSDGTTQISDTLTPETAQLLSNLHPAMFPGGCDGVIKIADQESSADDREAEPERELNETIPTLPSMEIPDSDLPDTNIHVHDTEVHNTAILDTEIHGTDIHNTLIHGTEIHGTAIHGTAIHGTAIHNTLIHGTAIHGTEIHNTEIHGTEIHDTEMHDTEMVPVTQNVDETTTETEESTTEGELTDGTIAELIQPDAAS